MPPIIHNKTISRLIKNSYSFQDIQNLFSLLHQNNTFSFSILDNGLFPAAKLQKKAEYTGYSNVWVRDNVYIAYAHYLNDYTEVALKNIKTLTRYFIKHKWRFEEIITGKLDYNEPMNRPHIRFNGEDLSEINQKWAHAENDALGYFLWLFCKLNNETGNPLTLEERELLTLFVLYFESIRYWEDEDSGHWEEVRKIEASSIGVVTGGLMEFKKLLQKETEERFCYDGKTITDSFLIYLIDKGKDALEQILPAESIQSDKNRRYDAALLFLIYPINIVSEKIADQILFEVSHHLQGDYGIRRYLGDSFWSADYKKKLKPKKRTIDFSDNIFMRDSLVDIGQEAQWCIFDPIISIIYGLKYQKYKQEKHFQLQTYYFNRSLGQLTAEDSPFGGLKCPELYYLEEGQYVLNDVVPLLWTQANLWMAFKFMKDSLTCSDF